MSPAISCVTLLLALGTLSSAAPALAEKTDQIILRNGDHLTGEIKGMSLGKLDFKTDDAGRLSVEWLKVVSVVSKHGFEVEMVSGRKYYGPLLPCPTAGELLVGDKDQDSVPLAKVADITPMDATFWSRVAAYLDLGFTVAKANTAITLSGDGEFAYRGERLGVAFDFNTYFQTDTNSTLVSQYSTQLTGTYYFTRWRMMLATGASHNDELGLELRLSVGALTSYPVFRSFSNEIWLTGGLVAARELYSGVEPNLNLAAYIGGEWQAFRYDSPKLDSDLDVNCLPVLNDPGRVRGTVSYRVKYEVFRDFNLGVKVSFTYDTRPPDPTASHTDYLASLTIGWSYRR
jgi:hypothetical protein